VLAIFSEGIPQTKFLLSQMACSLPLAMFQSAPDAVRFVARTR
jgi:hypothetical protein